ncbi:polyubiquitin-like [Diospyros lotus]|uniref:polyubiquitin-like n=1 Tax=Diospyros lotus TaxID=55363 RepID=UPI00225A989E|nr:polyubiquitin-like [Diospyros lotus]
MEPRQEEMNIYLKVIKTVALKVRTVDTVKNVKKILHEKEGISENLQELFCNGDRLKDDFKLVDYGIQADSTLHVVLQNFHSMELFVYMPSQQKTLTVEAKLCDTVQDVKSFIHAREGIGSDSYTLFHSGKLLEDNRTLASLNIQSRSVLCLVFNPKEVLSVSVKMPNGEILKPEVKLLSTIHDVKAIMGSIIGFSGSEHCIICAGKELENSKTLAYYGITEDAILEMVPSAFPIFVKDLNGKTVVVKVHQNDTVKDVKCKIFNKEEKVVDFTSLLFAGKSLKDGRDLASYNIRKDCTLRLVYRVACYLS